MSNQCGSWSGTSSRHAFAGRVDQAGVLGEGRVHLQEAVVAPCPRLVEQQLDDAKALVHRVEQCAIALFAGAKLLLRVLAVGDVRRRAKDAPRRAVRAGTQDARDFYPAHLTVVAADGPALEIQAHALRRREHHGLLECFHVVGMDEPRCEAALTVAGASAAVMPNSW